MAYSRIRFEIQNSATMTLVQASQVNGEWTLAPIKKSVQKLIANLDFRIDAFNLDAMTRECLGLKKVDTFRKGNTCQKWIKATLLERATGSFVQNGG